MARIIQVFEFEKLTLHTDWKGRQLLPRELERLLELNDNNNNINENSADEDEEYRQSPKKTKQKSVPAHIREIF